MKNTIDPVLNKVLTRDWLRAEGEQVAQLWRDRAVVPEPAVVPWAGKRHVHLLPPGAQ